MTQIRRDENGLTSNSIITGPELYVITSFISLALYNVLELNGLIFNTFKVRRGVYFWSMLLTTWGIAFNATGFLLKFLRPDSATSLRALYTVLVLVGWTAMITGQSVVLFSRLHLLVHDRFIIRFVLAMIIVDAFICHPPTIALFALVNSSNPDRFAAAYSVFEKFQLVVFFVQEFIISAIYIIESAKFLKTRTTISNDSRRVSRARGHKARDSARTVIYWLISVNIAVVLLDICILSLEFSGYYDLQTSFKAFVYSTKLKLEFYILNKLIEVVKARNPDLFDSGGIRLNVLSPGNIRTASGEKASVVEQPQPPKESMTNAEKDRTIPVQTAVEDTSPASAVPRAAPMWTKEQNSSRSTVPHRIGGRVPNFSVLRRG